MGEVTWHPILHEGGALLSFLLSLILAVVISGSLAQSVVIILIGLTVWWGTTNLVSASQFTWPNPLAVDSRANRAIRSGRVGESARNYANAGQKDKVVEVLRTGLPSWQVRATLIDGAIEVIELKNGVQIARRAGLPGATVGPLVRSIEEAADILWRTADRLSAVAALKVDSPGVQQGLQREQERLSRLAGAIREARQGLAELTLVRAQGPEEIASIEKRFRNLSQTAHAMEELLN